MEQISASSTNYWPIQTMSTFTPNWLNARLSITTTGHIVSFPI
ncbi:hypothetical protein SAMN05216299_106142 [Nitrosospira sp. Nsp14]|nr:hypothetical protein SAMN05216299_106142 [Nitrosospira sp. Nsp14]